MRLLLLPVVKVTWMGTEFINIFCPFGINEFPIQSRSQQIAVPVSLMPDPVDTVI